LESQSGMSDAQRKQFIGGSDAPGILGVSPWDTPLDIYLKKRGERERVPPDLKRERLFKRGKRLEPVVIDMLIDEYEIKVTKRSTPEEPNRYADAEHPFLAAEIDFEWEVTRSVAERLGVPPSLIGSIQNGEVKTVHPFASAKFGEAETDEVPIEYAAQAMHGLMVTNRQLTLFGVLVGSDNLLPYPLYRDEETIATIRQKVVSFWFDHVLAGVPPDPAHLADVVKLLRKAPSSTLEASEEILALCGELAVEKDRKAAAEDRETEIKYQIGKFVLGEAGILLGNAGKLLPGPDVKPGVHLLTRAGMPVLKVALQNQRRIDTERLRRDHPEVAHECSRESSFFRFDPPQRRKR